MGKKKQIIHNDYRLILVVGQTGTGKTTWVRKLLENQPYIVIDPVGAWSDIPEAETLEELDRWQGKTPIRITSLIHEMEEEVLETLKTFQKINLVIDDADTFIFLRPRGYWMSFFFAYRHLKHNIFIICHSYADVPTSVKRTADLHIVFPHISPVPIPGGQKFKPRIYTRDQVLEIFWKMKVKS